MVVDSSALLCVFLGESDSDAISARLDQADRLIMSAPTFLESWVAVLRRFGPDRTVDLEAMLRALQIEIVPFTEQHAQIAQEAYVRFGKGRHAAALNLGDCFSYALAQASGELLLFKGNDFAQTDVRPA